MFLDTLNNHATQRWSSTLDGGQPEPIIRVIHGWREKIEGDELMISEKLHYEGEKIERGDKNAVERRRSTTTRLSNERLFARARMRENALPY